MDDSAVAKLHNRPNDPNAHYDESNTTRYYYYDTPAGGDGASSPVLPQVVEIKDGSGGTTDQFVWGSAYVDELLLHERDADGDPNDLDQRLYAAHDTLYSVLRLVDEDGNVVERYSYSPYGADPTDPRKGAARITDGDENELTPDDSVGRYLYTGRQFDKTVGLNYHRARRLSHNLGRWTRRDPLGVDLLPAGPSASPVEQYRDGADLYAYAMARPSIFTDPEGYCSIRRCGPYRDKGVSKELETFTGLGWAKYPVPGKTRLLGCEVYEEQGGRYTTDFYISDQVLLGVKFVGSVKGEMQDADVTIHHFRYFRPPTFAEFNGGWSGGRQISIKGRVCRKMEVCVRKCKRKCCTSETDSRGRPKVEEFETILSGKTNPQYGTVTGDSIANAKCSLFPPGYVPLNEAGNWFAYQPPPMTCTDNDVEKCPKTK